MFWRRFLLIPLAILTALSLTGSTCNKNKEAEHFQEMSNDLCEAARDFNKLLVWRNYELSSLMIVPSRRIDFLIEAEKYAGTLQIEDYSVVVCQVDDAPPARDLKLPDTDITKTPAPAAAKKEEEGRKYIEKEEAVEAVKKDPAPQPEKLATKAGIERPKQKKPKKEDVFYGTVLVRYINRSILPSASVDTKLIKQYWISVGEVWYCDFEWPEMIKR
jgi:hypothetical protein